MSKNSEFPIIDLKLDQKTNDFIRLIEKMSNEWEVNFIYAHMVPKEKLNLYNEQS